MRGAHPPRAESNWALERAGTRPQGGDAALTAAPVGMGSRKPTLNSSLQSRLNAGKGTVIGTTAPERCASTMLLYSYDFGLEICSWGDEHCAAFLLSAVSPAGGSAWAEVQWSPCWWFCRHRLA